MKHQFIRAAGIFCLLLLAVSALADTGTWSPNQFFYQPPVAARGTKEKNNFDMGLNRVDAHLARYKTLGDPGYSTLAEALTTIGSSKVTLTIPAGTVAITSNTTIGSNIALRIQNGGKFDVNSGVSLTINGTIDAGPYQIFSGSGPVNLGGVSTIYDVWYATPPTSPTSIAAPVGARFIKTSGSAPLVYVKESGTGTSGWVASSGSSGVTAFTGLTDAPSSYSGQAGKALRVNTGASGLEFYTPFSGVFTGLTDAPGSYTGQAGKTIRVNSTATGLEFYTPSSGEVSAFTGLTDVPTSYTGQAGKSLRVNSISNGLEFYTPSNSGIKPFNTLGDVGYETLANAITTIGSTVTTLVIPAGSGALAINSNTTIPANIDLRIYEGSKFDVANGVTLTIQGSIEAGPYQIFSWSGTGAFDLKSSPTKRCYFQWWGAQDEPYNSTFDDHDNGPLLQKAYDSLYGSQEIYVTKGIWRIATPVSVMNNGYPPDLVGEDTQLSTIYVDVGSANVGLTMGMYNPYHACYGCWIKNISFASKKNGCKNMVFCENWNAYGGMKRVDFYGGSTSYALRLSSVENCTWDISLGTNHMYYVFVAGIQTYLGTSYKGVGVIPGDDAPQQGGGGTYNKIRIMNTFASCGAQALYIENSGDWEIEKGDIENTFCGEGPWNMSGWPTGSNPPAGVALYNGGNTKVGEVFTLSQQTTIDNIGFYLACGGNPKGSCTAKIYNTSGGIPTTVVASSTTVVRAQTNPGGTTGVHAPFVFQFHNTLAAGTYAAVIEYGDGDSDNYLSVNQDGSGTSTYGAAYFYHGSAWSQDTLPLRFAINTKPAMEFYKCAHFKIHGQHFEANWEDFRMDYCQDMDVTDQHGMVFRIERSEKVRFGGTIYIQDLYIDPISEVTLGAAQINGNLYDYGKTTYAGPVSSGGGVFRPAVNIKGSNGINYCPNTLFDRWVNNSQPDGWGLSNNTWEKCGVGQSDTTRHLAPYCAKAVISDTANIGFSSFSNALNFCKGNYVSFYCWLMLPAGQRWGTSPCYFQAYCSVPDWAGNTTYKVGEMVNNASGQFVCQVAGTSAASPPDWSQVAGKETVWDGTVKWVNIQYTWAANWQISGGDPSLWSDGQWHRAGFTLYVPPNATNINMYLYGIKQSPSGNTIIYLAEPSLTIGSIPPIGIMLAPNEAQDYLQIGGVKIWVGLNTAPSDGRWCNQGDMWFRKDATTGQKMGGMCVTPGPAGGGAVWKDMPSLAN